VGNKRKNINKHNFLTLSLQRVDMVVSVDITTNLFQVNVKSIKCKRK